MSLIQEQAAFLLDIRKLLDHADKKGFIATGGELERRPETQKMLVDSGAESSMDSMHLRRCAMELYFFVEDDEVGFKLLQTLSELKPVGEYWESLDPRNRWITTPGSNLARAHFERDLGAWPSHRSQSSEGEEIAPSSEDRDGAVVQPKAASDVQHVTLRKGSNETAAVSQLQQLLQSLGLLESVDGDFGRKTDDAVKKFQKDNSLIADGVVGQKTWNALLSKTPDEQTATANLWLSDQDIVDAANEADVDEPAMRAVYEVESNGAGFIGTQPKILFEGHVFWRRLINAGLAPEDHQHGNSDILYRKWTREHYVGGAKEHQRLKKAQIIHHDAALESASWGLFQIMGYHWKALGYDSVQDYEAKMSSHEREQLLAFVRFIQHKKTKSGQTLAKVLKKHDWSTFAYYYNGSGYRKNRYDEKMRKAWLKYSARA